MRFLCVAAVSTTACPPPAVEGAWTLRANGAVIPSSDVPVESARGLRRCGRAPYAEASALPFGRGPATDLSVRFPPIPSSDRILPRLSHFRQALAVVASSWARAGLAACGWGMRISGECLVAPGRVPGRHALPPPYPPEHAGGCRAPRNWAEVTRVERPRNGTSATR